MKILSIVFFLLVLIPSTGLAQQARVVRLETETTALAGNKATVATRVAKLPATISEQAQFVGTTDGAFTCVIRAIRINVVGGQGVSAEDKTSLTEALAWPEVAAFVRTRETGEIIVLGVALKQGKILPTALDSYSLNQNRFSNRGLATLVMLPSENELPLSITDERGDHHSIGVLRSVSEGNRLTLHRPVR